MHESLNGAWCPGASVIWDGSGSILASGRSARLRFRIPNPLHREDGGTVYFAGIVRHDHIDSYGRRN
jgi:hypothetical protein